MYRALQDSGSAEISESPFYHPILPLLCDMTRAREAMPALTLPRERTDLAEDARVQVARAVESYRTYFGREPRGLWPSEGSVSPEVVELAAAAGFRWMATDEGILARSLGRPLDRDAQGDLRQPDLLYQPYRAAAGNAAVSVVFRDHVLSDLVGFHYYNRPGPEAADDLIARLRHIAQRAGRKPAFVAIILDGENAWEHYRDGGIGFLDGLYARLAATPGLHPVTVSEYLDAHPPTTTLPALFSGSWINSNFGVWIGHEEDRRAWDAVAATRRFLVQHTNGSPPTPATAAAWEELYTAEGSDWFWWFGDDRTSGRDAEFDRLFRGHLQNVYRVLGAQPPDWLDEPIAGLAAPASATPPRGFMKIQPDGRQTDFYEWLPAGVYDRARDRGVMEKQTPDTLRRICYGFDADTLFLRVDTRQRFVADVPTGARLVVRFTDPRDTDLEVRDLHSPRPALLTEGRPCRAALAAAGDILEVACPFEELGFGPRDGVRFTVRLYDGEQFLERAPRAGAIAFEVPTPDFEHEMWEV
jgi:hypothetical protein